MKIAAGTMIGDGVRLERMLAEGGMGSVWLAENVRLGSRVAVKFMSRALAKDPAALARFTREARLASRIPSPHVVRIFDCRVPEVPHVGDEADDETVPFMIMEWLEGEDLSSRLERGRLSLDETAELVAQLGEALASAHVRGVVHRDVKPENVFLVDVPGRPFAKLLDFGIAKDAGDIALDVTAAGATMGTPHYMSPEQMMTPKEVDGRCDLWALAVVAYSCLTKRMPFEGDTFGAVVIKIHRGEYEPPTSVDPALPKALDAWFARAFHRDIERRFQTPAEMSEALFDVARGAHASPSGPEAAVEPSCPDVTASGTRLADLTPPPSVRAPSVRMPRAAARARSGVLMLAGVAAVIGVAAVALANVVGPSERAFGAPSDTANPPEMDASVPLYDGAMPDTGPPSLLDASPSLDAPLPELDAFPLK